AGSLRFVFGKPSGEAVGAGAEVLPAQFEVTFDGSGSRTQEHNQTRTKSVAEPNCLTEDVVKVMAASVPDAASLKLRYGMSDKLGRAVWRVYRAESEEILRTLDGASCNILSEK